MNVEKFISPLIASQFPAFYETEGPTFIAFVKAYYEWMESTYYQDKFLDILSEEEYKNYSPEEQAFYTKSIQPLAFARNLYDIKNIDTTQTQFIQYFKNKYISSLPSDIIADKKLLVKHILDLYRTKGTKRSYELLFRLLFNEDIDFVVPADFIFKPSDATWHIPKYIEVTDHPLLKELIGKRIYTRTDGFAVVENYFIKIVNEKTVNVLLLTGIQGNMEFGEQIFCDDVYIDSNNNIIDNRTYANLNASEQIKFKLAFTFDGIFENVNNIAVPPAPIIFGSLSAVSITNGGAFFKVGQLLDIDYGGEGGYARVAAVRDENGKVIFKLVDGGRGFTLESIVTVHSVNGGGAGATFQVGDIIDREIYYIVKDKISSYKDVAIDDNITSGSALILSDFSQELQDLEGIHRLDTITSVALTLVADVVPNYTSESVAEYGEIFQNLELGIDGLRAYRIDGNCIYFTGEYANLSNPRLLPGVILTSDFTNSIIKINNISEIRHIYSKAEVENDDPESYPSTIPGIKNIIVNKIQYIDDSAEEEYPGGYFVPFNQIIINDDPTLTAYIDRNIRLTDWEFPRALGLGLISNMDTKIGDLLTTKVLETGTISYLKNINPGYGYSANPIVSILEPDIYDLRIKDNNNGYYGYNAKIDATASIATGVVTAVYIEDSGYGYNPDQTIRLSSMELENDYVVTGTAIVDSIGKGKGYYKNNKGFLSDTINIQDSDYYQSFSYEIVASRMIDTYEKYVKDLIHPSGMKLFGKFALTREMLDDVMETYEFTLQERENISIDSTIITIDKTATLNEVLGEFEPFTIDKTDRLEPNTIVQEDN
jgi:hypothetical protein